MKRLNFNCQEPENQNSTPTSALRLGLPRKIDTKSKRLAAASAYSCLRDFCQVVLPVTACGIGIPLSSIRRNPIAPNRAAGFSVAPCLSSRHEIDALIRCGLLAEE